MIHFTLLHPKMTQSILASWTFFPQAFDANYHFGGCEAPRGQQP
jgi:hypothetical protein